MTALRSIPPNRSPRRPRQTRRQPAGRSVAPPDQTELAAREYVRKALANNRRFWKEELVTWQEEFGEEYVAQLKATIYP